MIAKTTDWTRAKLRIRPPNEGGEAKRPEKTEEKAIERAGV